MPYNIILDYSDSYPDDIEYIYQHTLKDVKYWFALHIHSGLYDIPHKVIDGGINSLKYADIRAAGKEGKLVISCNPISKRQIDFQGPFIRVKYVRSPAR